MDKAKLEVGCPHRRAEFIGQNRIKTDLRNRIHAARMRDEAFSPHLLVSAAAEMGKRTLAEAIAHELEVPVTLKHSRDLSAKMNLPEILSNRA
jgi:Holliday junction resolvasome RuvABC ATP-dependent DNA helicase subunit